MRITIDGEIDHIKVETENELIIMDDNSSLNAVEIDNKCIGEGTADIQYRGRLSMVALNADERTKVVDFINDMLAKRSSRITHIGD